MHRAIELKFTLVIYAAPYSGQAAKTAYNFAAKVLANGHEISRLFFFNDGVHNANRLAVTPQDESNLRESWDVLIKEHGLEAVVCVSSALKRAVIDASEAKRYELADSSLSEHFRIGGLGELIDACTTSDRLVNFG